MFSVICHSALWRRVLLITHSVLESAIKEQSHAAQTSVPWILCRSPTFFLMLIRVPKRHKSISLEEGTRNLEGNLESLKISLRTTPSEYRAACWMFSCSRTFFSSQHEVWPRLTRPVSGNSSCHLRGPPHFCPWPQGVKSPLLIFIHANVT